MANLAKSNAVWLRFLTRFFFILGIFRVVDFLYRRFGDEKRTLLTKLNDPRGNFGGTSPSHFSLAGVKVREDTLENGEVIVRVTGGSDPRTVTVYKATGGGAGDRICAGTANAGATATLTELNSSGVTGAYKLAASITADSDDLQRWFVQQDFRLDATNVFSGTDDDGEDSRSLQSVNAGLDRLESLLRDARSVCRDMLFAFMVADGANARAAGAKFLRSRYGSLLTEQPGVDGFGRVTQVRAGSLVDFFQAQVDEATGSTQTFRRRRVSAAAAVEQSGNRGRFKILAHTPEDQFPTGTVKLTVVNGKEQERPNGTLREELAVEWSSDVDDRSIQFSERATVGQLYKGPMGLGGALGFMIERVLTKTGDSGNDILADVASGFAFTGESLANTDGGQVTVELEQDGATSNYAVLVYSSASKTTLVGQSAPVAANAAFTVVAVNTTVAGLGFTGTLGDSPSDGATCTVDLNFGSSQNEDSEGSPDTLTMAVTLTDEGEASRLFARMPILGDNGFRLNGVASGELVDDDLVKANTHPDVYGATAA
jgi:hypothetical protein